MPPLDAVHIFEWLREIGPIQIDGNGRRPISWTEIRNWQEATFAPRNAAIARLLRAMSVAYLTESHLAEDTSRPSPWQDFLVHVDQEANERQLRAVLG
jgi:hypothetical protein